MVLSLRVSVACVVEERCDGGRNILHALVSQCQPTSNKDSDQDAIQTSGDKLVWDTYVMLPACTGVPVSAHLQQGL
jgi:hypothetical protein